MEAMKALSTNKKARFDYEILDTVEAGVVLTGGETKAAKAGRASLVGSFVIIRGNQAFLINCQIAPYQPRNVNFAYEPDRTRKLLLTKKEMNRWRDKIKNENLTLIPLRMYNKHGLIKIELGLARGKKKFDKRNAIRNKEVKRRIDRARRGEY